MNYKKCCLYDKDVCGSYNRHNKPVEGVFMVMDGLTYDTLPHLVSLKLKNAQDVCNDGYGNDGWDERKLIENRLGKVLNDNDMICAYHRLVNGINWRPSKKCQHQNHQQNQKKSPVTRPIPFELCQQISSRYNTCIPIGSVMCHNHLKAERMLTKQGQLGPQSVEDNVEVDAAENREDPDYVPEEIIISDDVLNRSNDTCEKLSETLEDSPSRVRLKRTHINDVTGPTIAYMKGKYRKSKEKFKQKFAEAIAPGQPYEMVMALLSSSSSESDDESSDIPEDLVRYVSIYKNSDEMSRTVILSLLDHSKHSKKLIMKTFNCTKYKVDVARKLKSQNAGLVLPTKNVWTRIRLDIKKCEHFLDFVFTSGLLQDVAYGVTKVKFDSGEEEVAHAMLTTKFSHTILFYLESCKANSYTPLSETSLWQVLRAIKPSQQKSLAGLDDVTADGMNAFDLLAESAQTFASVGKETVTDLECGKRYLKTRYQLHCSMSSVHTHSISHALSDPKCRALQVTGDNEQTDLVNSDMLSLFKAIQQVIEASNSEGSEDQKYDVKTACHNVCVYIKHLIRDTQQKKAKGSCFDLLDDNTCFWLKDYCQKILCMQFREGQKDYFGKKGMSLHVDVFFQKIDGVIKKVVYFTALFRCSQGLASTLCISQNVLREFKLKNPNITRVFTKSDNAGAYHGNFVFEALYNICKGEKLQLLRTDFNEPCRGKDQCDRESAAARCLINSYVDSGRNLMTAEDIYEALQYGNGMKDSYICVMAIDEEKVEIVGEPIKNVSSYHSVEFHENHMKLWRYFDIGEGIQESYCGVKFNPKYDVIKPFLYCDKRENGCGNHQESKPREDRVLCTLQFCLQENCSASFETKSALEEHMLSGKHVYPKQKTAMDRVKVAFMDRMKSSSQLHLPTSTADEMAFADINFETACRLYPVLSFFKEPGWALPVRSNFRFCFAQLSLLYRYFMDGEKSGKKMSPEQVEKLLRKDLTPDLYVTTQQIKSLFSRWAVKLKNGNLKPPQEKAVGRRKVDRVDQVDEGDVDEPNGDDNDDDDDDVETFKNDLKEQVNHVFRQLSSINQDDWVTVVYDGNWYPSQVNKIDENGVTVSCMEPVAVASATASYRWPKKPDVHVYLEDDVLCQIESPQPVNQRGSFGLTNFDMAKSIEAYNEYMGI